MLDRALANEAAKLNVVVTVDRLREFISNVPAFQQDGKFSYDRYKAFLASRGQSEATFEQSLRNDLRKQAVVQAVVESAITPKQVIDRIDRILLEQREVRELRFPAEQFASKVAVTDAQIAEYYEANRSQFGIPESARVEYVVLSPDTVAGNVKVTEEQVKNYYEQNKARYGTEEQRRASHILIAADGSDKSTARKKADEILAKIRANPNEFAKLARENSKDPGSAGQGGDLGFWPRRWSSRSRAAYRMKAGEAATSQQTSGFTSSVSPRSACAGKGVSECRGYRTRIEKSAGTENFTESADSPNLVYEQADSLQPARNSPQSIERRHLTRQGLLPH